MKGMKLEDDMYLNAPNSKGRSFKKNRSRSPSPKRYSWETQHVKKEEDIYKCRHCPDQSVFSSYSKNDLELHQIRVHGVVSGEVDSRSFKKSPSSPSPESLPRK